MVEKDFEEILKMRAVPEPRSNLAERIIEASLHSKPQRQTELSGLLHMFFTFFLLPRPATVMTLVLLAGLVMGLTVDVSSLVLGEEELLSSYLYIEDNSNEGDWL